MHSLPRKLTQYLLIILTCYALLHSLIAVAELGSAATQPNGEIATDVQLIDLADSLDNKKFGVGSLIYDSANQLIGCELIEIL